MVGNDVVDLTDRDADVASYSPRFDARVFSAEELESIECAESPSRQRWRLWAAKEASFKLARKLDPTTIFSPRCFGVTLSGLSDVCQRGIVLHEDETFQVEVCDDDDLVHAVAIPLSARFADLVVSVRRISEGVDLSGVTPGRLSEAVRRLAIEHVAPRLGVARSMLRIEREDRMPGLWLGEQRLPHGLSLSHHGAIVAFACSLMAAEKR